MTTPEVLLDYISKFRMTTMSYVFSATNYSSLNKMINIEFCLVKILSMISKV